MYLKRHLESAIRRASRQFPVLLLTGSRQVGKTTLLRKLAGKRAYVSLDDPDQRALAQREPELFLQRHPAPLLIDEVQYAPELLPQLKRLVDAKRRKGGYWLTGSQQFHLMKGVTESLAGRVAVLNLTGLSTRELLKDGRALPPFLGQPSELQRRLRKPGPGTADALYRRIWAGSFPELATGSVKDRDLFFSSYLQTYLQRDVRDLAQVGDLNDFLRFIKACAARTAQMLNLSDLARDVDVSVNTAKAWLSILVAGYQVALLQPWSGNNTKRLIATPKLYFLDTGLCAYLAGWSSPESLAAGSMAGSLLETYVHAEIVKSWWNQGKLPELFFFRDIDGREVDFALVKDRVLYPVEVKHGASAKSEWTAGFGALSRLKIELGPAVVLCLKREPVALRPGIDAFPVACL